jgi:hypothetical protein
MAENYRSHSSSRARSRAIRARMAETGVNWTVAAREIDGEEVARLLDEKALLEQQVHAMSQQVCARTQEVFVEHVFGLCLEYVQQRLTTTLAHATCVGCESAIDGPCAVHKAERARQLEAAAGRFHADVSGLLQVLFEDLRPMQASGLP